MDHELSQNKMGVMPISKLLISMSLPMMASMLVQALYNIVDSIYVSRISEAALTAVSISFPIQNLMISMGVGVAVGVNALLSKSLGEGDRKKASDVAMQGIFIEAICYVIFLLVGLFALDLFFTSQTDDLQIARMGKEYLSICCICSFGIYAQLIFERLLQSTGRTSLAMCSQLIGAITNIILDPLFIFGVPALGLAPMGVSGAAIATVVGQCFGAIAAFIMNRLKNKELTLTLKGFRPRGDLIGGILFVGVPSAIMSSIGSVMTFGVNKILFSFGEIGKTGTAVFGVYFKLQSFVFMPVFGLNSGMIPIIAFNYGARKRSRIMETFKFSGIYAVSIMLLGLAVFQFASEPLLRLFDASSQMLEIGVPALRTISLCFVFAGFCIVCSSMFQALGNGLYSMLMSIIRQLVVLLPAAFLLSKAFGMGAVWYAFPLAEIFSVVFCLLMLRRTYRKVIRPLDEPQ